MWLSGGHFLDKSKVTIPEITLRIETEGMRLTINRLHDRASSLPLDELRLAPWYQALYLKRNDKTRQRDLRRLREAGLAHLDADNALWPGFIEIHASRRKPMPGPG